MMDKYKEYLVILESKLNNFFEQQSPYIFCKEGCSICCETGTYPMSKIEFDYIMEGYDLLSNEIKEKINQNINTIKENKNKAEQNNFFHPCPFLINKRCSVYNYRALICRGYGLMSFYDDKNGEKQYHMPCCVDNGLNYSQVYDKNLKTITSEKWEKIGIEAEPLAYNVGLTFLLDNEITKKINLQLGSAKNFIEWVP